MEGSQTYNVETIHITFKFKIPDESLDMWIKQLEFYYNELMNAQEKQIIFDKKGNRKKSKQKTMKRYENSGTKSYSRLNLSNNMF